MEGEKLAAYLLSSSVFSLKYTVIDHQIGQDGGGKAGCISGIVTCLLL
jgi:hypothetical protein